MDETEPITREEALAALRAEQTSDDPETAHMRADEILCKLLVSIGCGDVVVEYEKINKWYT